MDQNETPTTGGGDSPQPDGVTVVAIPQAHTQAVLDFLAGLGSDTEDVSGHMINRGMIGGIGGLAATAKGTPTHTGCERYDSKNGYDFDCSDTDTSTTSY